MTKERRFIRLSEADSLPIKKSTLYKCSALDKNPELFSKVDGMVFVDTHAIDEFLEANKGF